MNHIDLSKYNSLKLGARVVYISSEFTVKTINEDGSIVLKPECKNLPDRLVKAGNVRYCYKNNQKSKKKYQLSME